MNRLFTIFTLSLAAVLIAAPREMTLVRNGKALFRIVTADGLGRVSRIGPEDFVAFTKEATGAKVKVVAASKLSDEKEELINVYLGIKSYGDRFAFDYPKPAGFRVIFPDDRSIVIAGVPLGDEDFNTNDGVVWFLERHLGIRFLMPGELGTFVPKIEGDWKVPCDDFQRVPDFFVRQFAGVHGQAYGKRERHEQNAAFLFAMRSSMTASAALKLNHNVGNLVDPELYAESHPEFFPLIDGKRRIPPKLPDPKWRLLNWEPCYTAAGIAEEAAKNVIKYFDENPTLYSCSLSVNDSGNICQCESCRKVNAGLPSDSESQSYYEWVQKVVGIVREKYPDRYFGILNYWATKEMPKNIKLDKAVIPIVCEDFNFYVSPKLDEKLEERLRQWDDTASNIGWWDYSFEGDYLIPSYNAHYMARKLKQLYDKHNLRVYTDELHPSRFCRNAPEVYMLMKLLWDINLNPDELLDEWFRLAVGPKAAPFLKAYFEIWEDVWTNRIPQTSWFIERAKTGAPFLQRRESSYLDAISYDDVEKALELLRKCVENAPEGNERRRARFFLDYFAMAADSYYIPYINSGRLAAEKGQMPSKTLHRYTFDDNYEPWVSWQADRHTAILRHNSEIGHDAPGCLELNLADSLETGMTFYRRPLDFTLSPDGCYRLSVWCRGKNLNPEDGAQLIVFFPLKEGSVLGRGPNGKGALTLKANIHGDKFVKDEWHKLSIYISVPKTAWHNVTGVDCQLEAGTHAKNGTVFFDDFSIEQIDPPNSLLIQEFNMAKRSDEPSVFIDAETGEHLGPELITDGDMEADGVSAWTDSYSPALKEKSTEHYHSGRQSLHIVSDGAGDGVLQIIRPTVVKELFVIPSKGFKVGSEYRVQIWVKNALKGGCNEIRLAGTPLKEPLATGDGEWHKFVRRVKYEKDITTDFIVIGYGSDKSDVFIDDLSIREILP